MMPAHSSSFLHLLFSALIDLLSFRSQKRFPVILLPVISVLLLACGRPGVDFRSGDLELKWEKHQDGSFHLAAVQVGSSRASLKGNEGAFTVIYSERKPEETAIPELKELFGKTFVEGIDKHAVKEFDRVLGPVSFNRAGASSQIFPDMLEIRGDSLLMKGGNDDVDLVSSWQVRKSGPACDLLIRTTLTARKDGFYSMTTPSLMETDREEITWATVPGYFQGSSVATDLVKAYGYGHGIPGEPVVLRDRNAATLTSILSVKNGITLAASAAPGYGRDAWAEDKNTHGLWKLGLGIMTPAGAFTPTLYYPVLGQQDSWMKKGEQRTFEYRISLAETDWYEMLSHVINDINGFPASLAMRQNTRQSLTGRIAAMSSFVKDDRTSMWNVESFQGLSIGAQSYLGGVTGADKDAMKNSDYGAMWMMAAIAQDSVLARTRLPFARNFKLVQQQTAPGFFQGAAVGQYYLRKSKQFVEEWGDYVEPIGLTYYTMLDDGNILLFNPDDTVLKERLRIGAEKLVEWQKPDGSWEVAYNKTTKAPAFTDIKDYRPTFYGLLVAYRLLKDPRYLDGAKKGADWLMKEGVNKGFFLGVCGDARYVPDFATAQTAQSFLDLFEITGDDRYLDAAKLAARFYVSSIYTHPVSREIKTVKGNKLEQWQIAQNGLSFEHGGNFGSATTTGPILLAGHAGLFVRMYGLTKDSIFLNMARAAAIGRDAFVDSATSVASYYWSAMNAGAGAFPHHAWWQIGWIMDYLLSEASLRSGGNIKFPGGFVTPKVGPHKSYGFEKGEVYGEPAALKIFPGFLQCNNPNVEILTAVSDKKIFVILMNDLAAPQTAAIAVNADKTGKKWTTVSEFKPGGQAGSALQQEFNIRLDGYGLKVYVIE